MAKKIVVYRGSKPATTIKKSAVLMAIRRLIMEWVVENVSARYVEVRPAEIVPAARVDSPRRAYIPDKMPPNLDARLGIVVQVPALANQVRFRHF